MRLQDKICIVTGAAQGIGLATATKFAREGAVVIACDRRADAVDAAVDACRAAGGRASARAKERLGHVGPGLRPRADGGLGQDACDGRSRRARIDLRLQGARKDVAREQACGLTALRLYVCAAMLWIGGVLGWMLVTHLRRAPALFAAGAATLGILAVLRLNAMNPDRTIAEFNLARAQRTGNLDGAFPTYRRGVVALDTGGAIRGPVRADLYIGRGDVAGREAGRIRHRLTMWRLVPAA